MSQGGRSSAPGVSEPTVGQRGQGWSQAQAGFGNLQAESSLARHTHRSRHQLHAQHMHPPRMVAAHSLILQTEVPPTPPRLPLAHQLLFVLLKALQLSASLPRQLLLQLLKPLRLSSAVPLPEHPRDPAPQDQHHLQVLLARSPLDNTGPASSSAQLCNSDIYHHEFPWASKRARTIYNN